MLRQLIFKCKIELVSHLLLRAQSTARGYIRAEHKRYYNSKLNIISQVIILPQVMFSKPIYMPQALNTAACIQQGDLFYPAGLHRNQH